MSWVFLAVSLILPLITVKGSKTNGALLKKIALLTFVFAGALYQAPFAENHYSTLNVPVTSNFAQIKHAFRSASVNVHPDKSNADADQFMMLRAAYEILNSHQKRPIYDKFGARECRHCVTASDYINDSFVEIALTYAGLILFGYLATGPGGLAPFRVAAAVLLAVIGWAHYMLIATGHFSLLDTTRYFPYTPIFQLISGFHFGFVVVVGSAVAFAAVRGVDDRTDRVVLRDLELRVAKMDGLLVAHIKALEEAFQQLGKAVESRRTAGPVDDPTPLSH